MSKFKLMLRGSALQSLDAVVAIIVGFVTLPLMQSHLGGELYAVWILIGGFTSLLYIFDLGFASSVTRGVAGSISLGDHEKTNTIINSALLVYSGLAGLILLFVLGVIVFYKPDSSTIISLTDFRWVLFIVGLSIAIEFPFKAFAGISNAQLRFDLVACYRITIKLLNLAITWILLAKGYKLIALALLSLGLSVVSNFMFLALAKSTYKHIKIQAKYVSRHVLKELFGYSFWSFFIDINNILKNRIDVFFVGGYISLLALSIYYVPVRLVEYTVQLLLRGLNLGLPILSGNHAEGNNEDFSRNLILLNRVNVYFVSLTLLMFAIIGKTLIYYWMGSSFDYDSAYVVLMILMAGRLAVVGTNGISTALYAKAKHKVLAYVTLVETVFSGILLYIALAVFKGGVVSAAMAIACPLIVFRLCFLPWMSLGSLELTQPLHHLWISFRPLLLPFVMLPFLLWFPLDAVFSFFHVYLAVGTGLAVILFVFIEIRAQERLLLARLLRLK